MWNEYSPADGVMASRCFTIPVVGMASNGSGDGSTATHVHPNRRTIASANCPKLAPRSRTRESALIYLGCRVCQWTLSMVIVLVGTPLTRALPAVGTSRPSGISRLGRTLTAIRGEAD